MKPIKIKQKMSLILLAMVIKAETTFVLSPLFGKLNPASKSIALPSKVHPDYAPCYRHAPVAAVHPPPGQQSQYQPAYASYLPSPVSAAAPAPVYTPRHRLVSESVPGHHTVQPTYIVHLIQPIVYRPAPSLVTKRLEPAARLRSDSQNVPGHHESNVVQADVTTQDLPSKDPAVSFTQWNATADTAEKSVHASYTVREGKSEPSVEKVGYQK